MSAKLPPGDTPADATVDANGESPLQFPVEFPIKVIGRDSPTFTDTVFAILDRHFVGVERDAMDTRPSRKGNYLAITTTVRAETRAQLDGAYEALTAHAEVLWAL
jgi:putative lipoic acid-binding regulatory protein